MIEKGEKEIQNTKYKNDMLKKYPNIIKLIRGVNGRV